MQRLKGRNIVFGALAVLACSGDPTGNESTPTAIQSNPDVVFVTQGDSEPVVVSVLDEDGNVLQADFTDERRRERDHGQARPDLSGGNDRQPDPARQPGSSSRAWTWPNTSFKVNALGLTKTIEVTSVPGAARRRRSPTASPTLGDTVTITAPTGTFFTDTSVLTFNGAAPVVDGQDETTISFIPMPNIFGPALVSNVGVASNPAVVVRAGHAVQRQDRFDHRYRHRLSTTAPALGAPVTLTLPAGLSCCPRAWSR